MVALMAFDSEVMDLSAFRLWASIRPDLFILLCTFLDTFAFIF